MSPYGSLVVSSLAFRLPTGRGEEMQSNSVDVFKIASQSFVGAVELVPEGHWHTPGLGRWSVLEL